jgi:hypothetical protein
MEPSRRNVEASLSGVQKIAARFYKGITLIRCTAWTCKWRHKGAWFDESRILYLLEARERILFAVHDGKFTEKGAPGTNGRERTENRPSRVRALGLTSGSTVGRL